MNRDNIKKVLILCVDSICDDCPYADTKDCYNQIKLDARELIIEQENEIAQLKAENVRLTAKLGQVLLSIDTVKEMNTMCNIEAQIKQAKIDVLNKVNEKIRVISRKFGDCGMAAMFKCSCAVDELIREVQNAEDKD